MLFLECSLVDLFLVMIFKTRSGWRKYMNQLYCLVVKADFLGLSTVRIRDVRILVSGNNLLSINVDRKCLSVYQCKKHHIRYTVECTPCKTMQTWGQGVMDDEATCSQQKFTTVFDSNKIG